MRNDYRVTRLMEHVIGFRRGAGTCRPLLSDVLKGEGEDGNKGKQGYYGYPHDNVLTNIFRLAVHDNDYLGC